MILTHAEAKALVHANDVDPYQLVQAVEKAVLAKISESIAESSRRWAQIDSATIASKAEKP